MCDVIYLDISYPCNLYLLNLISRYYLVGYKNKNCVRILNVNSANEQDNTYNILEKGNRGEITPKNRRNRKEKEYNHKRLRISVPCLVFHLLSELCNYFSTIIIFNVHLSSYRRCMLIDKANWKFCIFFFCRFAIKLKVLPFNVFTTMRLRTQEYCDATLPNSWTQEQKWTKNRQFNEIRK